LKSSDARNKTAAAISSGCPIRLKGTIEKTASTIPSGASSKAPVLIGPGLHVHPYPTAFQFNRPCAGKNRKSHFACTVSAQPLHYFGYGWRASHYN